jgi:hypothetical protein
MLKRSSQLSGFQLIHPTNEKCLSLEVESSQDFIKSFDEFSNVHYILKNRKSDQHQPSDYLVKLTTCDMNVEKDDALNEEVLKTLWRLNGQSILQPYLLADDSSLFHKKGYFIYSNSSSENENPLNFQVLFNQMVLPQISSHAQIVDNSQGIVSASYVFSSVSPSKEVAVF